MLEIASDNSDGGVFQKDISKNQDISIKYLDHIIAGLKAAELIKNVKGKKSGYVLTKSPKDITIYEIHVAFEKEICVIDCMHLKNECENSGTCRPQKFWKGLNKVVYDYFTSTTLEDIMGYEVD